MEEFYKEIGESRGESGRIRREGRRGRDRGEEARRDRGGRAEGGRQGTSPLRLLRELLPPPRGVPGACVHDRVRAAGRHPERPASLDDRRVQVHLRGRRQRGVAPSGDGTPRGVREERRYA